MLPLSPALFVAVARGLLSSRHTWLEDSDSSELRDDVDPRFRDLHHPDDGVTTAAFIAHCGYWSHSFSRGHTLWPLPLRADCDELHRIASDCGIESMGTPDPGAIYLRYSMMEQRYTRAAIVIAGADDPRKSDVGLAYDCIVLEGSARILDLALRTTVQNRREVSRFNTDVQWARRTRVWCCPMLGDRFINWVDLDERKALSDPTRRVA
jgi:hypothetical protein